MSNLRHKAPTPKTPIPVFHPRVNQLRGLKSKLVKETRDLQFKQALDRITSLEAQVKHLHALFSARLSDDIDFRDEFEKMRVHLKQNKKAVHRHLRHF
jgi:hypothetical protein